MSFGGGGYHVQKKRGEEVDGHLKEEKGDAKIGAEKKIYQGKHIYMERPTREKETRPRRCQRGGLKG